VRTAPADSENKKKDRDPEYGGAQTTRLLGGQRGWRSNCAGDGGGGASNWQGKEEKSRGEK